MADLELVQDFVNTADLEQQRDDFRDARGLVRWLALHRLAGPHVHAREADAADARAVREALRELLRANNGIDVDEAAAAATLDAAARRAGLAVRFEKGAIRLVPAGGGVQGGLGERSRRRRRGDGRRLVAAPQGMSRRRLPMGVRRSRAQPLAPMVRHARLWEQAKGPRVSGQACVRGCASWRRSCRRCSRSEHRLGVLARASDFPAAAVILMSATTFAGSSQVAAISVLGAGGGVAAAVVAALLLNVRYAPIGITIAARSAGPSGGASPRRSSSSTSRGRSRVEGRRASIVA